MIKRIRRRKKLWIATTTDEYEFIVFIADNSEVLDRLMGTCIGYARTYVARAKEGVSHGKNSQYLIYKVEVDWSDKDQEMEE